MWGGVGQQWQSRCQGRGLSTCLPPLDLDLVSDNPPSLFPSCSCGADAANPLFGDNVLAAGATGAAAGGNPLFETASSALSDVPQVIEEVHIHRMQELYWSRLL